MRWTLTSVRAQPFEDLALIVADHQMESEGTPSGPSTGAAPTGTPGRKRVTRTTTFEAA